MPYIKQEDRQRISIPVKNILAPGVRTVGDLNYAITLLCHEFLTHLHDDQKVGYADYNSVVGVLESAKLEFYRRMIVPYEDTKIQENGDV